MEDGKKEEIQRTESSLSPQFLRELRIGKQAKDILDNFSKALDKVKTGKKEIKKSVGGFRDEEEGKAGDSDFRERMFANAPMTEGDCIVAEKKSWK